MTDELHILQLRVKWPVADGANDVFAPRCEKLWMAQPTRIHTDKASRRIHFIVEWAELRHHKQADLVKLTGADKGTVSRWFSGNVPRDEYLVKLSALFGVEISDLFRHPDDDWMARFFRDRSEEEIERIRATLETAFPRRVA